MGLLLTKYRHIGEITQMAKYLVIPNDGDWLRFDGIQLFNADLCDEDVQKELRTGINDCIRSGVYLARATIGHVEKPVCGVGSGGTLFYDGADKSWEAVKNWIRQIEEEEASVRIVPDMGCGGCFIMFVGLVLPLAFLYGLLCNIGCDPVVKLFFRFIWFAVVGFFHSIWITLTTGRLW